MGVAGSAGESKFHRLWEELDAFQDRKVFDREEFVRIEGAKGKKLFLYAHVDGLEQHMKALSPDDAPIIQGFCNSVRLFSRLDMPLDKPRELYIGQWAEARV